MADSAHFPSMFFRKIMTSRKKVKAQMYIVTIIFLVGLIVTVQQSFLQYTNIDVTDAYTGSEYFLLKSIKDVSQETLLRSSDCTEFRDNIEETSTAINLLEPRSGKVIIVEPLVNCTAWMASPPSYPPLTLTVTVTSEGKDTREVFSLYR